MSYFLISGVKITSQGQPGHASAFIEDTAVKKLVSMG